jgi:hypothetical protein
VHSNGWHFEPDAIELLHSISNGCHFGPDTIEVHSIPNGCHFEKRDLAQ